MVFSTKCPSDNHRHQFDRLATVAAASVATTTTTTQAISWSRAIRRMYAIEKPGFTYVNTQTRFREQHTHTVSTHIPFIRGCYVFVVRAAADIWGCWMQINVCSFALSQTPVSPLAVRTIQFTLRCCSSTVPMTRASNKNHEFMYELMDARAVTIKRFSPDIDDWAPVSIDEFQRKSMASDSSFARDRIE